MTKNDKKKGCEYCVPNAAREYEVYKFVNPENDGEYAMMSFYGGEINCVFKKGEGREVKLTVRANYCKNCGRKFK